MGIIKQRIKRLYSRVKLSRLYQIHNTLANLFFRHNNLFFVLFRGVFNRNQIMLGRNVVLKNCRFEICGTRNFIKIGDDCRICGLRVYINSDCNRLIIGRNTIVNASKDQRTLFNPCNGGEISIGDNCLFSNNIELHTTDYHKIISDGVNVNLTKNIVIGKHCWIGLQTLILKGTVLPDNVIVGAKSLVNRQIEESNVIIAGNPAKIIKRDVNWTI